MPAVQFELRVSWVFLFVGTKSQQSANRSPMGHEVVVPDGPRAHSGSGPRLEIGTCQWKHLSAPQGRSPSEPEGAAALRAPIADASLLAVLANFLGLAGAGVAGLEHHHVDLAFSQQLCEEDSGGPATHQAHLR